MQGTTASILSIASFLIQNGNYVVLVQKPTHKRLNKNDEKFLAINHKTILERIDSFHEL